MRAPPGEVGGLCLPLLERRLGELRDVGNQHHDGSWGSSSFGGVDDDEASVAVHELMDDPETRDPGLDEIGTSRQPTLKTPGDSETETVVAAKKVADAGDEYAPRGINQRLSDQVRTRQCRAERGRLDDAD